VIFLFSVVVGVNRDGVPSGVDQNVDGVREGRTLLNQVVEDEPEGAVLSKNRGFVVQRPVFEVERELGGDLCSADGLDEIAGGESLTIQGMKHEKAVRDAFQMMHLDIVGMA